MEKKTDFKTLPIKSKIEYIWDYYRWHIIGGICVAAFLISIVHHYVTYKEPILNVLMVNCNDQDSAEEEGFKEFLEAYGYEADSELISLYATLKIIDNDALAYKDKQALTLVMAAGGQDLFFGSGESFLAYAEQGVLIDLSTILSDELLEKYSDHLIYSTNNGAADAYPCAIELTDNAWLLQGNYYESCYYGVFATADHPEAATQFTEYLLNYNDTNEQ